MLLLWLSFSIGLSYADITGTNPPTGTCLCLNINGVNVRRSACGTVAGNHNNGQCWKYEGAKESCDLSGTTYEFFSVDYPGGGWIAGNFLDTAADSRCESVGVCSEAVIVSRAGWNARAPTSTTPMSTPVQLVFIHHTAGSHCTTHATCEQQMRNIQSYHMDSRGWSDIGYSFVIGEDGRVYEGRGWSRVGAHTAGYNACAVALSLMGNFMGVAPNAAALKATQDMIQCGIDQGYVTPNHELYGHRQGGATACPGDNLYSIIQSWNGWRDATPACPS